MLCFEEKVIKGMKTVIFGVAISLAMLGGGAIMVEREMTFINFPLFIAVLLIIGAGIGLLIKGSLASLLFESAPSWVNIGIFSVVFTCILGGALLLWNSFGADENRMEEKEVVVERKFTKTRHKTQTTGRHTYSTGAPYKVYYLELKFKDGRQIEIQPPYKVYKNSTKGDTAYIRVGRGALYLPVCDVKSVRLKHPDKHKKRPYFYRSHRYKVVNN